LQTHKKIQIILITIQLTFFLRIHNVISGYTVDGELFGPQLKISRTVLKTDEVLYYQCLNSFKFQRYKSGRADNVGEKTFCEIKLLFLYPTLVAKITCYLKLLPFSMYMSKNRLIC